MSNKDLWIWELADELVVEIHEMTLTKLPKFEMFEEGGQIRMKLPIIIFMKNCRFSEKNKSFHKRSR